MTIKLIIRRIYRGVPFEVEADLQSISSVETVTRVFCEAERFIDRMLEKQAEQDKNKDEVQ